MIILTNKFNFLILNILHENFNVNLKTPVFSPNSKPIPSLSEMIETYGKVVSLLYEHSTIFLK